MGTNFVTSNWIFQALCLVTYSVTLFILLDFSVAKQYGFPEKHLSVIPNKATFLSI